MNSLCATRDRKLNIRTQIYLPEERHLYLLTIILQLISHVNVACHFAYHLAPLMAAWPASYAADAYFNPWPVKYLLRAVKWFPIYWPNADWEVIGMGPNGPTWPTPPDGAIIPWWKMPKDQWPIAAPWEDKVYGAWPASQVTMIENLQTTPPFGLIKLAMPGEPALKDHQIAFMKRKYICART